MPESSFYHISPEGNLVAVATLAEALAAAKNGGFSWLDYCQPTKEALAVLVDALGLHPLSIEDCTDMNQVPKIDNFPGNTFIIFNAFTYADRDLTIDEVDFFIGEKFLVTVSGYDNDGRRPLAGIQRIVELNLENARQGPAFLMHVILDYVVDQKFVAIEALEDDLEAAEEAMLADPASFNPAEMLHLRRVLLVLRKSLFHEREILVKICRKDSPFITEPAIYHFRDIYDHLTKFFEFTEMNRDILTSLTEMYLSLVNNRMADVANRTNRSVRRLTLITTVFMPLTLLAGIGGMSEWSMMTGPHNWRVAYPLFMLGIAVIGAVNYVLLRWVERKRGDRPADGS
jgi:magnesium transporter